MPKTIQIPPTLQTIQKNIEKPNPNGRTLATQPSPSPGIARSAAFQALSLVGIAITVSVTLKGFSYIFDPSEFLGSVKWVSRNVAELMVVVVSNNRGSLKQQKPWFNQPLDRCFFVRFFVVFSEFLGVCVFFVLFCKMEFFKKACLPGRIDEMLGGKIGEMISQS